MIAGWSEYTCHDGEKQVWNYVSAEFGIGRHALDLWYFGRRL